MGMARDGSQAVLTMRWRRVETDAGIHVEEYWGGSQGVVLFGPIPDEATATALIRERAAWMKQAFEAGRADALARYPQTVRFDRKALDLGDDDDGE